MKKQFFRVKQLADQTFLRAGKSEQLSVDLQEADQKVEFFRGALTAVGKRLGPNSTQGPNTEVYEKRLKKCMEYQLGLVMQEYGVKKDELDEGILLKPVLTKCGKTQMELARELADHEIKVEQMVSTPVHAIIENDIPNILKHKRNLSKLVLDKDSAYNRYQTSMKHGQKNESLRDEMEESELKVEQCRDSLACEMFSLLRKESEFAQTMLQLVKLQRAYHESALHTLESLIPELEKEIGDSPVKAVFGCPLEEHLRLNKRQIALPLELCVCALWELGMTEEGLFRVAGGASKVRRMKLSLDSGCFSCPLQIEYRDVHVIASVLKSYLRELPEPLLTYELYDKLMEAAKITSEERRLDAISEVLGELPTANYDNLRYLIKFLSELPKNPRNKMTSSNIAIVIAPNLLWSYNEMSNGIDMTNATIVNSVVEMLLSNVDRLFPGEFNVYYSLKRDELFSDLTEFERPSIAHLRSSSNDTALITLDHEMHAMNNSINERHSPPQGSPKPVMRRKNKPAPIPPLAMPNKTDSDKPPKPSYISGSSTINRATYRAAKTMHESDFNNTKNNKMSVSVGTDELGYTQVRRKSLDFEHSNIQPCNKPVQNSTKRNETHINKSDISSPINMESTVNIDTLKSADVNYTSLPPTNVHTIQSTNIHQITAQNATVGKIKVTSDNLQQKSNVTLPSYTNGKNSVKTTPVAAPRTLINEPPKNNFKVPQNAMTKSLNEIEFMDEEVQLRKSKEEISDKPGKPQVPERPATLRPMSFRVPRAGVGDPELATMLERTQIYSVPDKQQVSIVQVAQNRLSGGPERFKPGHDTQMAEKERFLGHQPDNIERVPMPRLSLENNRLVNDVNSNCTESSNLVRTQSVGSRPERPPKPEHMKSLERIDIEPPNNNTSQLRTMSHGDIVDSVESDSPTSPRSPMQAPLSPRSGFSRAPPQRPQPPPPPPPIRPKSDGESTDL